MWNKKHENDQIKPMPTDRESETLKGLKEIVRTAKENAYRKVNEELIKMYWKIGMQLSIAKSQAEFGDGFIDKVSEYIQKEFPGIKGFTRKGLYRMIQFYETYKEDEFVSTVLTQIHWSNHLAILSKSNSLEERHFYISLCIKEQYSVRELQRQIDSAYYERYMLSKDKLPAEIKHSSEDVPFMDTYVLDFLGLSQKFKENDLRDAIIERMKEFILEAGKDLSFIGKEYRIEVGNRDFYIDILFYHRGLKCLVAFEIKTGQFEPEYVSKMGLYLEALDRQKRKSDENPSVGIILCAYKDDEVVEFTLSRTLSPTMVSQYTLHLPDKTTLKKKLKEIILTSEYSL